MPSPSRNRRPARTPACRLAAVRARGRRRSLGLDARPPVHEFVLGSQTRLRRSGVTQVQRRQHEQAQQRGRDQTAQDHDRHRVHDLEPRVAGPMMNGIMTARSRRTRGDRRQPLERTPLDQTRAEGLALALDVLEAPDQHGAVPRCQGEQREEPDHRPERQLGAVDQCRRALPPRMRPAASGTRAPPGARRRRRPAAGGTSRSPPRSPNARICPLSSPPVVSCEHLRVVLEREGDTLEAILDLVRDRVETASADVGFHVQATRYLVTLDRKRRLHDPHVGHPAEAHVAPARACRSAGCARWRRSRACSALPAR